jgi:hypothetical protein
VAPSIHSPICFRCCICALTVKVLIEQNPLAPKNEDDSMDFFGFDGIGVAAMRRVSLPRHDDTGALANTSSVGFQAIFRTAGMTATGGSAPSGHRPAGDPATPRFVLPFRGRH